MNGAVFLARRPCHDGNPCFQQVLTRKFKVRIAAAEHFREQRLEPPIDLIERLLEALPGFAIDLAYGVVQGLQRFHQIFMLTVQIGLTLTLNLILLDGRKVDGTQTLNPGPDFLEVFGPGFLVGIFRQRGQHFLQADIQFLELLQVIACTNLQGLGFHFQLLEAGTDVLDGMFYAAATLLPITHLLINFFKRVSGSTQLFLFSQAPVQQAFQLHFQIFNGLFGVFAAFTENVESLVQTLFLQLHSINGLAQAIALAVQRLKLEL